MEKYLKEYIEKVTTENLLQVQKIMEEMKADGAESTEQEFISRGGEEFLQNIQDSLNEVTNDENSKEIAEIFRNTVNSLDLENVWLMVHEDGENDLDNAEFAESVIKSMSHEELAYINEICYTAMNEVNDALRYGDLSKAGSLVLETLYDSVTNYLAHIFCIANVSDEEFDEWCDKLPED